jgi:periplasmic mercuric ion binding protein
MKTLRIFSTVLLCCTIATTSFSQKTKTETFQVSGNCGMCEAKIEKAAKAAGATYADWNKDTKIITVKYNSTSSNLAKIQKSIADAGYDNVGVKTTTEAYNKLHACCQYDRTESNQAKDGAAKMDCCKDGKCTKEGHDGKDCCKNEEDHKH